MEPKKKLAKWLCLALNLSMFFSFVHRFESDRLASMMAELSDLGSVDRKLHSLHLRPPITTFVLDELRCDKDEDADVLLDAETHLAVLDDQLIGISADLQAITHTLDERLVNHLQDQELQQQLPFDQWMRDADSDLDALLANNNFDAVRNEGNFDLNLPLDEDQEWASALVAPELLHNVKSENNDHFRTFSMDHNYAKKEDNQVKKEEEEEDSSLTAIKEEPEEEQEELDTYSSASAVVKEENSSSSEETLSFTNDFEASGFTEDFEASGFAEDFEASALLVPKVKDEPDDSFMSFDSVRHTSVSPSSSSASSFALVESRDARKAKELALPFSVEALVNAPVDAFNEMLERHELTDAQLALCRDIRRRGKNKVAAQNCRKRKIDQIRCLEEDVAAMQQRKHQLMLEHEKLLMERTQWSGMVKQMHDFVLDNLGHDPAHWQLQRVGRGAHMRVAPRGANDNGLEEDGIRRSNDRRQRGKRSK